MNNFYAEIDDTENDPYAEGEEAEGDERTEDGAEGDEGEGDDTAY